MARNPFIDAQAPDPPKSKYTVTVANTGQIFEVDPEQLPGKRYDGQEGSLLRTLLAGGIDLDHACGGVLACSTCHIYVERVLDSAPAPIDEEEDMLDLAPSLRDSSRLACQCVPDGSVDVVIEMPIWKRNEVSEDH